jgi:hypothetical protein
VKNYLHFILIFVLVFVSSCGNNPEEVAYQAIDQALTLLSDGKCGDAIKLLEDLKDQEENPVFLKTYASAYACKAGFNMVRFVESDIEAIDDTDLLGSVSILTYSDETETDSPEYKAMKKSLEILGRSDFKQDTRNSDFGQRHGEDMGVQVLIYSIMQFGKYLNWYGNVDAAGKKGAGTNTNTCYLNYTYAPAQAVIGGFPASNACQSTSAGHPDISGADLIPRMCEGITLIANIYDVIKTIDLTSSSTLGALEDIVSELDSYETAAQAAGVEEFLTLTSPADCATLLATTTGMNEAELFLAIVLESEHE